MTSSHLDHPSEDALERFLLRHAQEDELETVETHILACNACVTRLEELEVQLTVTKMALRELSREAEAKQSTERRSIKDWFTFRTVSWAGAVAAVALTLTLTPHLLSPGSQPEDVTLTATRGSGMAAVAPNRPLHLHLSAQDIPNVPLRVVLVDGTGTEVWTGPAKAQNDQVDVTVPRIEATGTHFVRLYPAGKQASNGDLLREFPLEVK